MFGLAAQVAPLGVAVGAAACGLGLWGALALRRARRRWRVRRRLDRAADGERRAASLLVQRGYEIVGAQVPGQVVVRVDGERAAFDVFADYVVRRAGKTFVAEVKTGAVAPSLRTAATRRQMLEYCVAFDADGVLLVDAETDRVLTVDFFGASSPARVGTLLKLVLGASVVGVVVAVVVALVFLDARWP